MSNGESISITLSPAQVDQVVRAAAQGNTPSFSALISTTLNARRLAARAASAAADLASKSDASADAADEVSAQSINGYFPTYEDTRLSRSLLRGLSVLTCFGPENEERGILELASQLGMSPSTTHRYVVTLVELGLLERCTRSRKYRLPAMPNGSETGGASASGADGVRMTVSASEDARTPVSNAGVAGG